MSGAMLQTMSFCCIIHSALLVFMHFIASMIFSEKHIVEIQ
jgi:hypothetical protein